MFWKSAKLATAQGLSPLQVVSLSQKLKFSKKNNKRLWNDIGVVLCKTRLKKTPNIQKMTRL